MRNMRGRATGSKADRRTGLSVARDREFRGKIHVHLHTALNMRTKGDHYAWRAHVSDDTRAGLYDHRFRGGHISDDFAVEFHTLGFDMRLKGRSGRDGEPACELDATFDATLYNEVFGTVERASNGDLSTDDVGGRSATSRTHDQTYPSVLARRTPAAVPVEHGCSQAINRALTRSTRRRGGDAGSSCAPDAISWRAMPSSLPQAREDATRTRETLV